MNRTSFLTTVIGIFLLHSLAFGQSQDVPKFELAAEFTTLERDDFLNGRTEPGLGGRFTFNLNKVLSLEAAGYFFPKECFNCRNNGRVIQAVGGVKAGKRLEKWGIFGKARPGIVSFSDGEFNLSSHGTGDAVHRVYSRKKSGHEFRYRHRRCARILSFETTRNEVRRW
jgi:hypothetical protein